MNADDIMEPDPIELCELCGCASEDLEVLIHLRAADLLAQWERADPRDAWRHTGEAPPPAERISVRPRPYSTPQSTVDAFWYVASLDDTDYLKRWLAEHPRDVTALQKLWEAKHARS
jgi:hypothetical protein